MKKLYWVGVVVLVVSSWSSSRAVAQQPDDSEGIAFFEAAIRPILVKECYSCHSAGSDSLESGLALDTRAGIRRGGDRGPAVVPGDPGHSLLLEAIRQSSDDLQMPPKKKLSAEVIADFERWISMGAPDPREGAAAVTTPAVNLEQGRNHWAFRAPAMSELPNVADTGWPQSDVDRFVLAALEANGLTPVADADRRTLLRRLSFDLTGLPPSAAEMEAFLNDSSEDAIENVVDRLLASPHFGEKWARHWLDVARFAESTGRTVNFFYPHAWRYRDYVIAAFNNDKPYDQFIREQLAGDLLPSAAPEVQAERMIATGFLALGPKTLNERSGLKFELDAADEQIDVTTQAFLGITVSCARCHDHKFDPISQADYYALAGIFRSTETYYGTVSYINAQRVSRLLPLPAGADVAVAIEDLPAQDRQRIEEQISGVRDAMKNMQDPIQRFLTNGRVSLLQAQLDQYESDGTPRLLAMGVRDKRAGPAFRRRGFRLGNGNDAFVYDGSVTIGDSPIFVRGESDQPEAEAIPRGTIAILTTQPLEIPSRTSGRLELAEWIASADNPLTARVLVNRVWLQLFGRGLVSTADDFGFAGQPPSHPELLDYLAIRFSQNGWSIKQLIRSLVLTRVYQLDSVAKPDATERDPDNVLLWRMAPRRLDAECLRDAILSVSGQLDPKPPVGSAVARAGEGPVERFGATPIARAIEDLKNTHRSIYLPVIRDNLPEALALFDGADPSLITASRNQTTVPAQALFLMNNEFILRASDAAADQLLQMDDVEQRIETAFLKFYGRPVNPDEALQTRQFLAAYARQIGTDRNFNARSEHEVWSAFCQALFASAEFQLRR
ncbi:MAG: PSD1 domain-containing protein [Planctomycetaceae bacterium]|nr:PSD1 domain-containing protein [Planctomycetaceae bacterium]